MMYMQRVMSQRQCRRIQAHLKRGGVIAYPTESCFGLGCLPRHAKALKRVIQIKHRSQSKGMIVIGENVSQLQPLLQPLTKDATAFLNAHWPAAKTYIMPAATAVLPLLRGAGRRKLATRVPEHAAARQICAMLNTPLVSTSCNRSGQKATTTTRDTQRFLKQRAMVIGGMIGKNRHPSQIYDFPSLKRLR